MRAYVIDAFAESAFTGNPAGVVVLDGDAAPEWMQQVAAELKHSETAFVRERGTGEYDLRWFTPGVEVDLCGHATLATSYALYSLGAGAAFAFHTRSGVLRTVVAADGAVTMDFPAQAPQPVDAPAGLAEALGTQPVSVWGNGSDVLVEVSDAGTVARLAPDLVALGEVPCRGVIVTAAADDGADHDFVSRFFAPRVGVPEDPVTGSAHCALAPFWSARLGRTELVGVQRSARGGRVITALSGDRVSLTGRARMVLAGTLHA